MRFLLKALLAATALIPAATVATAQDAPEREGRWRGGAQGKIAERNAERGMEAPAPRQQMERPQMERQQPDRPQQRWDGNRGEGRAQPAPERQRGWAGGGERRWDGRGGDRPAPAAAPAPQPDAGARPDRAGDWNRPRLDPGRGDGRRFDGRDGTNRPDWNRDRRWQGGDGARPDGNRRAGRDDRRPDRDGWNRQDRNDRWNDRGDWNRGDRWSDRNTWNQPNRWNGSNAWNRTWRNDSRYDWNRYRTQNRSAYRLPRYYAPSGWGFGYRRFSIGVTLSQLLWDRNYWIDDPYAYRLPEVYGPYRWVRYYDDALLVDIRTGQVVDTVYDIFW